MKFRVITEPPCHDVWNVFRDDSTADYELLTWIGQVEYARGLNSRAYSSCKHGRTRPDGFVEALYFDSLDAAIKDVIA